MVAFILSQDSMRNKLLRVILLAFTLAGGIGGSILLIGGNTLAKNNLTEELTVTAKIIANRSVAAMEFLDPQQAKQNLAVGQFRSGIEKLCLYDPLGNLFAGYIVTQHAIKCEQNVLSSREVNVNLDSNFIHIIVPVEHDNDFLGHLQLVSNSQILFDAKLNMTVLILSVFVVGVVIAYWFSNNMITSALEPLEALHKTSRVIAENPYSPIRAEKTTQDEVGKVVTVFNDMLDVLAKENNSLALSEERFRSLCENAPLGVYLKSKMSGYQYVNEKWKALTACSLKEANKAEHYIIDEFQQEYKSLFDSAEKQQKTQIIEYKYCHTETGNRVFMEYITPVTGEDSIQHFIGSLVDVTELKNTKLELERLAFFDALTFLPNRRSFTDYLDLAIAKSQKNNSKFAVYMTDLDNFKRVNDSLGHEVGDKLLVDIASRLSNALFAGDVVARMGGDEFMIIVNNVKDEVYLDIASQRFLKALSITLSDKGQDVEIHGSMGIALYPTDTDNPEDLIRYADIAMYHAKEKSGNCVTYYSTDLSQRIEEKVQLEQRLMKALDNDELEVYIQPQYTADGRKMVWGEMLVRWNHKGTFIGPDKFIPLAEETGLIFRVGDFVIERTMALLAEHKAAYAELGIQGVSINLSARQFYADDLVDSISKKIAKYGIVPTMLDFELTESMVVDNVQRAIEIMQDLRTLGCRISLDDFGTGYSSLSYLQRFPLNCLKIDRSFIDNIQNNKQDLMISSTIIAMAHHLGLTVVAEGVETQEQADILAENGCELLQGYYFDKPMPVSELVERAVNYTI